MSIITIHNSTTGEILEREMNTQELAKLERIQQDFAAKVAAREEAEAKREAALAKLAALGLDPDDLKALGL
jgi:hypothetical protein